MNSRGFELAISTLIIIALGVILLIGLIYVLSDGFAFLRGSSEPYLDTAESAAVRESCRISCEQGDRLAYCCRNFSVQGMSLSCDDERLELDCSLSCRDFAC